MATASITSYGELSIGGHVYRWGSKQPQELTVTADNVMHRQHDVDASTTVLLWSAAVDLPSSFALLVLETTADVMIELLTDDDGSVGEEVYTVKLKVGAPLILGADDSYANYTVNFAGGTLDLIESIRARNLGASAARVTILLAD